MYPRLLGRLIYLSHTLDQVLLLLLV